MSWRACFRPVAFVVTALACASVFATDRRIPLEPGWDVSDGIAIGADRVVYSGIQMGDDDGEGHRVVRSRIVQHIGDRVVTTDFEGSCTAREYSPDGKLLLAIQLDPAVPRCCECAFGGVLIDDKGAVVARLPYGNRLVGFSTTGERLFLGGSCGWFHCHGEAIDLYRLDGRLAHTIEVGPFRYAVVIGDGSDLLLLDDLGVRRTRHGSTRWSSSVARYEGYPDIERSFAIPPDRFVIWDGGSVLLVLDLDGIVRFHHDADEPGSARIDEARPGPAGWLRLTLSDGEYLVDLERGMKHSISLDKTLPADFAVRDSGVSPMQLPGYEVFRGRGELLIRAIPTPAASDAPARLP